MLSYGFFLANLLALPDSLTIALTQIFKKHPAHINFSLQSSCFSKLINIHKLAFKIYQFQVKQTL